MKIEQDQPVLLLMEDGRTFLVRPQPGGTFATHQGMVRFDDMLERDYGEALTLTRGRRALLLRPTVEDFMMKVERSTNIVYPKDAGVIMLKIGVRPGARVLEVGCGSGSMTVALSAAVGPTGKVTAFDRTESTLEVNQRNLRRAGLGDNVELRQRAADTPLADEPETYDCAILDIAEPWTEVPWVRGALVSGGRIASLNPTYNQIERTAECLAEAGFLMIECMEILFRRILARTGKTRPAQQMVGHTEFLLFAIRGPQAGEFIYAPEPDRDGGHRP
ncbi:MAG: tRNA (adenine-N1)-methyltransferase [Candidatus Schekmanbacteria bacterium]|nr:tRNA (adenine-N1)-methyltransferase [Candidatus Schekmanbacteria bacterium]